MEYFWATKGGAKSGSGESTKLKVGSKDYLVVSSFSGAKKGGFNSEKVGRPNSLEGEKLREMLKLYYSHPYSFRQLADIFGVSRMTVWRAVQSSAVMPL